MEHIIDCSVKPQDLTITKLGSTQEQGTLHEDMILSTAQLQMHSPVNCSETAENQHAELRRAVSTDSPVSTCRVCGDESSGIHYGVHTCEGCKSFFKRSLQGKGQLFICAAEKRCQVDKQLRRNCAACRLQKCRDAGMKSNGVRKRRLEQRRSSGNPSSPRKLSKSNSDSESSYSPLSTDHRANSAPDLDQNHEPWSSLPSSPTSLPVHGVYFSDHKTTALDEQSFGVLEETLGSFESALCALIHAELNSIITWARTTPGFSTFTVKDQVETIESKCLSLIALALIGRSAAKDDSKLHFLIDESEIAYTPKDEQLTSARYKMMVKMITTPLKNHSLKTIQSLLEAKSLFSSLNVDIHELDLLKNVIVCEAAPIVQATQGSLFEKCRYQLEAYCAQHSAMPNRRIQNLYLGLRTVSAIAAQLETCLHLQADMIKSYHMLDLLS